MGSDDTFQGREQNTSLVCDLLVLGASFTGLELVWRLRKSRPNLHVVVVDRQARHVYIPLVHECLADRLADGDSWLDTRSELEARGAQFIHGEIVAFQPKVGEVRLADGRRIRGAAVVVALGSQLCPPQFPGREQLQAVKFGGQFEQARSALRARLCSSREASVAPQILVVGGGITGVELAGELASLGNHGTESLNAPVLTLVHSGDRLLPDQGRRAGRIAQDRLRALGVDIRLRTRLVRCDAQSATLLEAGRIESGEGRGELLLRFDLAFWAGGVRPGPIVAKLGLARTQDGWIKVSPELECDTGSVSGVRVFAAGDIARICEVRGEWPTMKRAIECLWQAKTLAKTLARLLGPNAPAHSQAKLVRHRLRRDFFHGISLGPSSLLVWGPFVVDLRSLGVGFRRWLMKLYMRRYS